MSYFWAKTTADGNPGISVCDHMMIVGCLARCIAETLPDLIDRFHLQSSVVGVLAALHDLGKISPGFQRKCKAWLRENSLETIARNGCWDTEMETDHGKVSHAAIQAFLVEAGIDRKTAKFSSAVLGAHHGRLNPPNDRGYRPAKLISEAASKVDWDAERMTNAQEVLNRFTCSNISFSLSDDSPALWWLAGLTSVADWIGSDERFFSPERRTVGEEVAFLAREALDTIGLIAPVINKNLSFEALFEFPPNDMQEKAIATITGPGVYVIEAPMGMGKTEAALGAAYQLMVAGKANGIYFALPTQATSNRIHLRMNEFMQRIAPDAPASRLIHSNSWLMQTAPELSPTATVTHGSANDDARTGRDWFSSAKRALIAPFGVGTVDQALLGVVAAKHFFVRHFALAGKVVILDEIHSYDLYTGTLIDKLITTLEGLGCTVIVLSATLTGKRRGQMVSCSEDLADEGERPYPLISGRNEGQPLEPVAATPPKSRNVKVEFISAEYAAEEAIKLARNGGAVLWICNTVSAAQKQYRRFKELDFPVGLLHSRFPFWQREKLETEWMGRFGKDGATRCGSILVSTQVVEQSVDLDADLLVSELAPTDMLLQRIGRLWRHKRRQRPVDVAQICIIEEAKSLEDFRAITPQEIKKELGGKAFVYDPFILLRTMEVWRKQQAVNIPEQIRSLIEATYKDRDCEPESWQKLYEETYGKILTYRQMALMSSNIWQVALNDEEGVQTRLNEMPTIALVLCKSISNNEGVFVDGYRGQLGGDDYRLVIAQAIHRNLVRVPRHLFDRVETCPKFSAYLYGEQSVGIVTDNETVDVKGLKSGVRLSYSDELGLSIEKISEEEDV
ncbi:MAG: CRISPR-associated helicase Cas3' [Desulfobulbaceae bacterium]|nr:CRISPR-associated helicase Cas3' [Desulfobulbaceae bacterium]